MSRLDPSALERVSGPAWLALRPAVLNIADQLLSASVDAKNALTTVYVKFERPDGSVYAVMWMKKSSEVVVGLALPLGFTAAGLYHPPVTLKYKGLTAYFTVKANEAVPTEVGEWARTAFNHK